MHSRFLLCILLYRYSLCGAEKTEKSNTGYQPVNMNDTNDAQEDTSIASPGEVEMMDGVLKVT